MADYKQHYRQIQAISASVVGVSVDAPEKSEALRVELSLPFPILCDTERRVIKELNIFNERERGGIAKPAVFVIDPGRAVRYVSVDTVAKRVPAEEIVKLLQTTVETRSVRRALHMPRWPQWFAAIRNNLRR